MTNAALEQRFESRPERDFHGAAVIAPDGREIPITEEMVSRSLAALDASWHNWRQRERASRG